MVEFDGGVLVVYDDEMKKAIVTSATFLTSSAVSMTDVIINHSIPSSVFFLVSLGYGINSFNRVLDLNKKRKRLNEIINSDQYAEYVELYSEYVSDIAGLFKNLNFENNLVSCFAYRYCLERGFLSKDSEFSYTIYKDHFDSLVDLYGGSIATGAGCCRHTSALLTDVINGMGGTAANIPVINIYGGKNSRSMYANHVLTGIVHNDKSLAVDTTTIFESFPFTGILFFKDNKKKNYVIVNPVSEECMYEQKLSLLFDKSKKNCERLKKVRDYSNYEGDFDEIINLYLETILDCCTHEDDFRTFSHDEQPKIKRLSKLNEYIAPHGEVEYHR